MSHISTCQCPQSFPLEPDFSVFRTRASDSYPPVHHAVSSRRALLFPMLLAMLSLSAAACNNDDSVTGIATTRNIERNYSVFALSGTSPGLPAAYYFITETLVRPQQLTTGALNFEVAFDILPDGRAALMPATVVIPLPPAGASLVGIQTSETPFKDLTRAPNRGFTYDSTFTGKAGDTFVIQLYNSGCPFGDPYYAKIGIDSVVTSERRIVFRSIVNRNCGFRGLTEGIPTN